MTDILLLFNQSKGLGSEGQRCKQKYERFQFSFRRRTLIEKLV